jgi:hypothetical protein
MAGADQTRLVGEHDGLCGANPLGVESLADLASLLEVVAVMALVATLVGGVAAFVVRWLRCRGPRRRQLAWFAPAVAAVVAGMATDVGASPAIEVLMAVTIFVALVAGMAWPLLGPLRVRAEVAPSEPGGRSGD